MVLTPLEALTPEAGEVLLQLRELRAEEVSLVLQRPQQPGRASAAGGCSGGGGGVGGGGGGFGSAVG